MKSENEEIFPNNSENKKHKLKMATAVENILDFTKELS